MARKVFTPGPNEYRKVNHGPQDQQTAAVAQAVKALESSGLKFEARNLDSTQAQILVRDPSGPSVDFYPRTGEWRMVGKGAPPTTLKGGVHAFLAWYRRKR